MTIKDFEKVFGGRVPTLQNVRTSYAVLVPIVMRNRVPHLLFEVRSDSIGRQPGEVCFPGGHMEAGESPTECALRETEEELAIPQKSIRILAELDFLCLPSDHLLHPILAEIPVKAADACRPSPDEVKEIFEVPFSFFQNTQPQVYTYDLVPQPPTDFPYALIGFDGSYPWRAGKVDVPIYLYDSHPIWGLTGRICRALAAQMKSAAPKKKVSIGEYTHIDHPFPPLYDADSRILILGSFPSVKSREGMFFYHHPQNRFWKVIAALTGEPTPASIEEKSRMLHKHHIALWDVIHSCDIIGSSDSSIKNVVVNDLSQILEAGQIRQIFVNGATAGRLYKKYTEPVLGKPCTVLPSTSPANAASSLEKLISVWSDAVLPHLN